MPELEDEGLEHTEDAGQKTVERTHALLEQLATSVNNLTSNVGTLSTHVAKLEVQKAAETAAHGVREGVNDGMDTVGAGTSVITKGVDVPLAIGEDVIHDAGTTVNNGTDAVTTATTKTRKKLFRRKRK